MTRLGSTAIVDDHGPSADDHGPSVDDPFWKPPRHPQTTRLDTSALDGHQQEGQRSIPCHLAHRCSAQTLSRSLETLDSGSQGSQWTVFSQPAAVDPLGPSTERQKSNIDRLSAERHSVCWSLQLQLQLASGPQSPGSPSLIRQRKGDTNDQVRATRGVDRFEVTVEADAEWSCSVQKVLPESKPHDCQTLNPSSSRIIDTTLNGMPLENLHARRQGADGSHSAMNTPTSKHGEEEKEQPLPTLPKIHTNAPFQQVITSVAHMCR